ncbi:hypothetical protein TNCV_4719391 [Trichonephila clavipes]|uniref:Uncharacterized protein n=1 Tax=Trichonephila clavipes TaxID=2585209 RepID=A0A8X7BEY7_TRICX|nr:hypothetical protein TNCV_4719391 [Trichonephila clavipes]
MLHIALLLLQENNITYSTTKYQKLISFFFPVSGISGLPDLSNISPGDLPNLSALPDVPNIDLSPGDLPNLSNLPDLSNISPGDLPDLSELGLPSLSQLPDLSNISPGDLPSLSGLGLPSRKFLFLKSYIP